MGGIDREKAPDLAISALQICRSVVHLKRGYVQRMHAEEKSVNAFTPFDFGGT